jgi:hypothetical protein
LSVVNHNHEVGALIRELPERVPSDDIHCPYVWGNRTAVAVEVFVLAHAGEALLLRCCRKFLHVGNAPWHMFTLPARMLYLYEDVGRTGKGYQHFTFGRTSTERLPLHNAKSVLGQMKRDTRFCKTCIPVLRCWDCLDDGEEFPKATLSLQEP